MILKETMEYKGYLFNIEVDYDEFEEPPWLTNDGHDPVSGWTTRDKKPSEVVLSTVGGAKLYYDFGMAMKMAKKGRWDAAPYGQGTRGERAERVVKADIKYLKDYINMVWVYVTLSVTLQGSDDYTTSLGGVEYDYSENGYWMTEVHLMADELIANKLADLRAAKIASRFKDAMTCGL